MGEEVNQLGATADDAQQEKAPTAAPSSSAAAHIRSYFGLLSDIQATLSHNAALAAQLPAGGSAIRAVISSAPQITQAAAADASAAGDARRPAGRSAASSSGRKRSRSVGASSGRHETAAAGRAADAGHAAAAGSGGGAAAAGDDDDGSAGGNEPAQLAAWAAEHMASAAAAAPDSHYKGVEYMPAERKWQAYIVDHTLDEVIWLDKYERELDAAVAHDRELLLRLGAAAHPHLNFQVSSSSGFGPADSSGLDPSLAALLMGGGAGALQQHTPAADGGQGLGLAEQPREQRISLLQLVQEAAAQPPQQQQQRRQQPPRSDPLLQLLQASALQQDGGAEGLLQQIAAAARQEQEHSPGPVELAPPEAAAGGDDSGRKRRKKPAAAGAAGAGGTKIVSQYKGVSWNSSSGKWVAVIWDRERRKARHIGVYESEAAAARAYDREVLATQGANNKGLNFRDSIERYQAEVGRLPAGAAASGGANSSSSYRGVSWHERSKRWESRAWGHGRQHFVGSFATEAEAAHAYDRAILKLGGAGPKSTSRLNFPLSDYDLDDIQAMDFPVTGGGRQQQQQQQGGAGQVAAAKKRKLPRGRAKAAAAAAAAAEDSTSLSED